MEDDEDEDDVVVVKVVVVWDGDVDELDCGVDVNAGEVVKSVGDVDDAFVDEEGTVVCSTVVVTSGVDVVFVDVSLAASVVGVVVAVAVVVFRVEINSKTFKY